MQKKYIVLISALAILAVAVAVGVGISRNNRVNNQNEQQEKDNEKSSIFQKRKRTSLLRNKRRKCRRNLRQ